MSNKPHLRPHKKQRQASRTTRVLVLLLFIAIFVLAIALAATGRGVPAGRIIPLRVGGGRSVATSPIFPALVGRVPSGGSQRRLALSAPQVHP